MASGNRRWLLDCPFVIRDLPNVRRGVKSGPGTRSRHGLAANRRNLPAAGSNEMDALNPKRAWRLSEKRLRRCRPAGKVRSTAGQQQDSAWRTARPNLQKEGRKEEAEAGLSNVILRPRPDTWMISGSIRSSRMLHVSPRGDMPRRQRPRPEGTEPGERLPKEGRTAKRAGRRLPGAGRRVRRSELDARPRFSRIRKSSCRVS
jgi:hypothetical protein